MAEYIVESKPAIIEQQTRVIVRVLLVGLVLGVIAWVLTYLLQHYVLKAIFCQNEQAVCSNLAVYAGNITAVIMAVIGVVAMVRIGVYRPLLVALCVMVSLWGLAGWLGKLGVLESVFWTALLYGVAYTLYAWLARLRQPIVMLLVVLGVVVLTRVIPMFVK